MAFDVTVIQLLIYNLFVGTCNFCVLKTESGTHLRDKNNSSGSNDDYKNSIAEL